MLFFLMRMSGRRRLQLFLLTLIVGVGILPPDKYMVEAVKCHKCKGSDNCKVDQATETEECEGYCVKTIRGYTQGNHSSWPADDFKPTVLGVVLEKKCDPRPEVGACALQLTKNTGCMAEEKSSMTLLEKCAAKKALRGRSLDLPSLELVNDNYQPPEGFVHENQDFSGYCFCNSDLCNKGSDGVDKIAYSYDNDGSAAVCYKNCDGAACAWDVQGPWERHLCYDSGYCSKAFIRQREIVRKECVEKEHGDCIVKLSKSNSGGGIKGCLIHTEENMERVLECMTKVIGKPLRDELKSEVKRRSGEEICVCNEYLCNGGTSYPTALKCYKCDSEAACKANDQTVVVECDGYCTTSIHTGKKSVTKRGCSSFKKFGECALKKYPTEGCVWEPDIYKVHVCAGAARQIGRRSTYAPTEEDLKEEKESKLRKECYCNKDLCNDSKLGSNKASSIMPQSMVFIIIGIGASLAVTTGAAGLGLKLITVIT